MVFFIFQLFGTLESFSPFCCSKIIFYSILFKKCSQKIYLRTLLCSLGSCFLVLSFISDICSPPPHFILSFCLSSVVHLLLYLIINAIAYNVCHKVDLVLCQWLWCRKLSSAYLVSLSLNAEPLLFKWHYDNELNAQLWGAGGTNKKCFCMCEYILLFLLQFNFCTQRTECRSLLNIFVEYRGS